MMKHEYFEGTAIYLVVAWEQALFLTVADCEFLC